MKKLILATILSLTFGVATLAQKPKTPAPAKPAATAPADPKAVPPKPIPPAVTVWMQKYHKLEELSDVLTDEKKEAGIDKQEKRANDMINDLRISVPEGYHFDQQKDGLVENPPTDKTSKDISKSVPAPTTPKKDK